ncbi:glycosyltransferase [Janthinobacterium sp. TB1-E2]|uniref:Glycosyltransferase involved in cell wall bisynthesis n=2 Tax=Janthinobacterium TaxID=29580 RepID=A0AB38CHY8_9BURK|nr:glycosyltransferase [Janthinobacterium lividum]SFY35768.1 Glycosyltransferase involved in cell wall bisynthesis [Janthinobacterium lividum]
MKILYLSAVVPGASGSGGKRACYNHFVELQKMATAVHAVFVSVDDTQLDVAILDSGKTSWKLFARETPRIGAGLRAKLSALFDLFVGRWPRQCKAAYSREAIAHIAEYISQNPVDVIVVEHISGLALLDKRVSGIPVVYISHNVETHILRDQLIYSSQNSIYRFLFSLELQKMKVFEKKIIQKANGVICISSVDVDETVDLADGAADKVVHWQELNALKPIRWKYTGKKQLLFVGSASYFPNREAIEWLVNTLMPEIFKIDPSIGLYLCGSSAADVDLRVAAPNVHFLGFVSDEMLEEYHRESDLFVSPIRLGGGIKMKVLDVLSYGMPMVASRESMRGIDFIQRFPTIDFNDIPATARMIVELLVSEQRLNNLSATIVQQLKDEIASRAELLDVVKTLTVH